MGSLITSGSELPGTHHRGLQPRTEVSTPGFPVQEEVVQGFASNLGSKRDSSSENLTLGLSEARIFLAGPEVLAMLPQPLSCPPHCSPPGDGGGRLLSPGSFLGGQQISPSLLCPGPRPPPLSSEDCAESGPLGLLREYLMKSLLP